MNLAHMKQLHSVLVAEHNHPSVHFDITTWNEENPTCRTHACAIGLAIQDDYFTQRGFMLKQDQRAARDDIYSIHYARSLVPTYGDLQEFDAICKFFDIDKDTAHYLFNGYEYEEEYNAPEYVKLEHVIERVEQVMQDYVVSLTEEAVKEDYQKAA